MYQQTRLSDLSAIGAPGPIPYCVANWHDAELADLDAMKLDPQFGLAGMGFWPVIVSVASFDPSKQVATDGLAGLTVDAANKRWTATQAERDLTAAELAAALATAQQAQIATLSAACGAQILAGYTSSALGAPHSYPAKPTDQNNMTASVLDSVVPGLPDGWTTPFWCADSTGTWAYRPHSAAQIQVAGRDGKAAILTAQQRNATLAAQVMAATTVAAVEAVTW